MNLDTKDVPLYLILLSAVSNKLPDWLKIETMKRARNRKQKNL